MKLVVYVRNKNNRPSDYYRIIQYIKDFDAEVIIRSAIPDKIDRWSLDSKHKIGRLLSLLLCYLFVMKNYLTGTIKDKKIKPDCVIVVREIFPRKLPAIFRKSLIKRCSSTNLIWDFDDRIIGSEISQSEADIYYEYAKKIVVSTPYLKQNLPTSVHEKTEVLCTTDGDLSDINLDEVNVKRKESFNKQVNVVWVATANNLPNLLDVVDYFEIAAQRLKKESGKELHLRVVCNRKIEREFKYLKVDNITWTHDVALKEILSAHIGIMPLINNRFALGKAGFKLIQYMSGGLPIIASNVGYNSSIANQNIGFSVNQEDASEWINAVLSLSNDYGKWEKLSKNSRREWEDKYSYRSHLDYWNGLMKG